MQQPEAHRDGRQAHGAKASRATDGASVRAHLFGDGPVALSGRSILPIDLRSLLALLLVLVLLPGCGPPT